ncbi:MAG: hypothetical protein NTU73_00795 [Ignavibacteriae bacterium]|nr:hypothetical protein [Ignavibacteriota bacterium]
MNNSNYIQNKSSVERLIALWALSEGFLGGILHLAKIPFTGLILGNVAVIIITLIAKFSDKRGTILKATLIVLIVKGILSPYTPLTAYLAVSLQGIFGELLFYKRKFPFVSALLLGILVSLFSSIQKVFFLTVIFGKNLWDSIDQFTLIIFKEFFGLINSEITISKWLIVTYASVHLIAGILTGLYAARLARKTDAILKNESNKILFDVNSFIEEKKHKVKRAKHRRWWFKPSGIIFFLLTILLFAYSYLYPDYPYIKKDSLLIMLLRGILLMFIWYKFLSPLLMIGFKKVMNKKRNKYTSEIENVVNVLPLFKSIINFCWKETSNEKGSKRLHRFFTLSLLNLLTVELIKE